MFTLLKWALLILGLIVILNFVFFIIVKSKIKDNLKLSDLMGFFGLNFGLYILCSFVFSIFAFLKFGVFEGLIMLLFVVSPFIIGKFATYKTKYIFTIIQFLCIILNIVYGFWIL